MKVYPSLLSCDFGRLREEALACEQAGADGLHVDVMDGSFVPNLTFGAPVLRSLKGAVKIPLDCHLMVNNPDHLIKDFVDAGAQQITIHAEACIHLHRSIQHIKSFGVKAGVSINPATSYSELEWILDDVDFILSMTVNPGFGGQSLIPAALEKTKAMAQWLKQKNKNHIQIIVDGGVSAQNIAQVKEAGVHIVVAGTAVFGQKDYAAAMKALKV